MVGDRFYEMGSEDGDYPAAGFHTRGEMGGFWTPPIKLLDGIWFKAGGTWLKSSRYTSGWGYQRMDLGTHDGVGITRTDLAPEGARAGLIGLRLSSSSAKTLDLSVDAHSELMKHYPWGETTPSQTTYNLQDTGSVDGRNLAVPHRQRRVRHSDLDGPRRAHGVHAQHLDHGGRRGDRPDGEHPAPALHDRQRAGAARPVRVGAAGRDAGDLSLARGRRSGS